MLKHDNKKDNMKGVTFAEIEDRGLQYYYDLFNKLYFNNSLKPIKPKWNKRMINTIGLYKFKNHRGNMDKDKIFEESLELSYKVIQYNPHIFLETLVHEMIHVKYPFNGHGSKFEKETKRLKEEFDLNIDVFLDTNRPDINDDYFNYIYGCENDCDLIIKRTRKMDTDKYICSACKGKLVLLKDNKKNR